MPDETEKGVPVSQSADLYSADRRLREQDTKHCDKREFQIAVERE